MTNSEKLKQIYEHKINRTLKRIEKGYYEKNNRKNKI